MAIPWRELFYHVPHLAFRTVILFALVLVVMRWTGKRTVSAMAPFDLALVILVSEVAAIPITELDVDLLHGLVPMLLLGALHIGLTRLNLYSKKIEEYTEGKPTLVISRGRILQENLQRERVSVDDLKAALRLHQVTEAGHVQECWLEPTGGVSVILLPQYRPLTLADLQPGGALDRWWAERAPGATLPAAHPATGGEGQPSAEA